MTTASCTSSAAIAVTGGQRMLSAAAVQQILDTNDPNGQMSNARYDFTVIPNARYDCAVIPEEQQRDAMRDAMGAEIAVVPVI